MKKKKTLKFPEISAPTSGKILYFPSCEPNKTFIPLPKKRTDFDQFLEFEVNSDALKSYGIDGTDLLTCRRNFSFSETDKDTIFILRIDGDYLARTAKIDKKKDKVVLNCGRVERFDDVEFIAIAIELRKPLI